MQAWRYRRTYRQLLNTRRIRLERDLRLLTGEQPLTDNRRARWAPMAAVSAERRPVRLGRRSLTIRAAALTLVAVAAIAAADPEPPADAHTAVEP